jgi:glycosyltransferase involved in cell wall biosynthesis
MHNSQSKFTAHFGALRSSLPEDPSSVFTVVLLAQEGNNDLAAAASVRRQTLKNWELLVVSPPSGSTSLTDKLVSEIGPHQVSGTELFSLAHVISSRPTKYISFLDQGTIWHNQRLAHDYYLLENFSVAAVASTALFLASDDTRARVARAPLARNSIAYGKEYVRSLLETNIQFSPATVSAVKDAFLGAVSASDLTPAAPLLRMLVSTPLYCSDKCLSELKQQPYDWEVYARELLAANDRRIDESTKQRSSLAERDQQIANLSQLLAERYQEINNLRDLLGERDQQISDLSRASDVAISEIAAMRSSRSWRLTSPLRSVGHLARGEIGVAAGVLRYFGERIVDRMPLRRHLNRELAPAPEGLAPSAVASASISKPLSPVPLASSEKCLERSSPASASLAGGGAAIIKRCPTVSIVLPCYNAGKWLPESLKSIESQTFSDWELLCVDDGSEDESAELLRNFRSSSCPENVHILQHEMEANRGLPASRNLAVSRARGKYVSLLDADDIWMPEKLEHDISIFEKYGSIGAVMSAAEYFYEDGSASHLDGYVNGDRVVEPPNYLFECLIAQKNCVPCPSAVTVKLRVLQNAGGFDERFANHEDQVFYAKLWLRNQVYISNSCLTRYRRHEQSMVSVSERTGNTQRLDFLLFLENLLLKYGDKFLLSAFDELCLRELESKRPSMVVSRKSENFRETNANSYF